MKGSRSVTITLDQMQALFRKSDSRGRVWKQTIQRSEIVFDFEDAPNCVIRVYSSIHSSGISAGVGADAIRVCAFNPATNRGIVKLPHVCRTKNWRDNLKRRVYECFHLARERLKYA